MADALGSTLTSYWQNLTTNDGAYSTLLTNEWVVASRLDTDTGQKFKAWDDYFHSPASYGGDHFTNSERYDPSNHLFTSEAAGIITINNLEPSHPTQPYQAEDIIILTDGLCSSACTLFIEMMHHEAGVRTVVVGGRPSPGPMQASGGTRGAAIYNARRLDRDISAAQNIDRSTRGQFPDRQHDFFITGLTINLRDQIRSGADEASPIPLQFQYEAADCRIFYTPKTWYNYTNLWTYAANAIWSDPGLCIATSADNHTHPPPHRQQNTVDNIERDTSNPANDPPQSNDPSNDIFSGAIYLQYYDLRPCKKDSDCAGGGRYSCREVEVCQNGFVKLLKRCIQSCSIRDDFCSHGSCEFDRHNRACNSPNARGRRQKGCYDAGYCHTPVWLGCLDRKRDYEYYRGHFDEQEKHWLRVAKEQGFDACDIYSEIDDYCYTLDEEKSESKVSGDGYDSDRGNQQVDDLWPGEEVDLDGLDDDSNRKSQDIDNLWLGEDDSDDSGHGNQEIDDLWPGEDDSDDSGLGNQEIDDLWPDDEDDYDEDDSDEDDSDKLDYDYQDEIQEMDDYWPDEEDDSDEVDYYDYDDGTQEMDDFLPDEEDGSG